ncbi:unnamed protein product [Caenorhabditis auriculariae]|uniref:Uncharacterized protein n=1 Tax=Caenorhabditis auriculariae TaxID=2777116 RepID=A0A8S1HKS0_9PELO|nr:unnamed protein product [Caenorhabditis auriculariae]
MVVMDTVFNTILSVSVPLNVLGFYLTAFVSMHDYTIRIFLLYLQALALIFDIYVALLVRPVLLLPSLTGHSRGLLQGVFPFNEQMIFGVFLLSWLAVGLTCGYIQKHRAVASVEAEHQLRSEYFWTIAGFLHVLPLFLNLPLMVMSFGRTIDKDELGDDWNSTRTFTENTTTKNAIFVLHRFKDDRWATASVFSAFALLFTVTSLSCGFAIHTLVMLHRLRNFAASKASGALSRLAGQLMVVFVTLLLPVIFLMTLLFLNIESGEEYFNVAITLMSTHSSAQVVVVTIKTARYRATVWKICLRIINHCRRKKQRNITASRESRKSEASHANIIQFQSFSRN